MPSGPVGYDRTYPPSHLWPPPRVIGLTVHELKELVDNGLEELPVGPEEAGVLAHDVHDVGGYDGLVVLPPLLLTQPQQVLENGTHGYYRLVIHHRFNHYKPCAHLVMGSEC